MPIVQCAIMNIPTYLIKKYTIIIQRDSTTFTSSSSLMRPKQKQKKNSKFFLEVRAVHTALHKVNITKTFAAGGYRWIVQESHTTLYT